MCVVFAFHTSFKFHPSAGNVKAAKRAVFVGMVFVSAWVLLLVVSTLAFKSLLPRLFTSDPCLLSALSVPMFIVSLTVGFDSVQGSLGGVVRASGKQLSGSFINVFTYWVFGLPLGTVLAIVTGLGAVGYWIALTCAPFLQAVLFAIMLLSMNWRKVSEKAQRMAGKSLEQTDSSKLTKFNAEVEEETNVHSDGGNTYCGQAVANGVAHSASAEENEACCEGEDNLAEEDVDSTPLLPNGSAESPQTASSFLNVLGEEKTSCFVHATSSLPNGTGPTHCDHTSSVGGSDCANEVQLDDDLLPLVSEEEEGGSNWERSEEESEADIETEVEAKLKSNPSFTTPPVSPIRLHTIILRVATLLAFVVLLAVSVTVSQLYVYQSSVGTCLNSTIAHNMTVNVTIAQPACAVY